MLAAFLVLSIIFIFVYRVKIKKVLAPFIVAAIAAYILMPVVNWLTERKFTRVKAIIIVYGIIALIIAVIVYYVFPLVLGELSQAGTLLPYYLQWLSDVERIIHRRYSAYMPPQVESAIIDNIGDINNQIFAVMSGIIKSTISFMRQSVSFILSPIIAFYILKDSRYLSRHFLMLFPGRYRETIRKLLLDIDRVIKGFINGQLLVALFVAVVTSISLYAIGLNFAIIIGIIAGVFNIVPYLGPIISGGLAVAVGLVQSPYKALSALIVFLIVHQIEGGILSPRIVGENVGLHPVVVIFSLLVGEEFFGMWGMLFSVPVTAALKVILNYIVDNMDTI